jgi:hypothetical protein
MSTILVDFIIKKLSLPGFTKFGAKYRKKLISLFI